MAEMAAVHFDPKTNRQIAAHTVRGVAGFTSWRRLEEIFRAAGEVKFNEALLSFQIDDRGITYWMDPRSPDDT